MRISDWSSDVCSSDLFYALATWGNAGFLREQVCKYMCPYARFQGAMFDRDTLIIAYDPMRGEPRGPRKRTLKDVFERGRGLLDVVTAYDYRSEEHTSELQSLMRISYAVFCLKKKNIQKPHTHI